MDEGKKVWLKASKLNTSHNSTIGWLQNVEARKYNINTISIALQKRLNTPIPFQLSTKKYYVQLPTSLFQSSQFNVQLKMPPNWKRLS